LKFVLQKAESLDCMRKESYGAGGSTRLDAITAWTQAALSDEAGEFATEFEVNGLLLSFI